MAGHNPYDRQLHNTNDPQVKRVIYTSAPPQTVRPLRIPTAVYRVMQQGLPAVPQPVPQNHLAVPYPLNPAYNAGAHDQGYSQNLGYLGFNQNQGYNQNQGFPLYV
jgi:hypothetical protein